MVCSVICVVLIRVVNKFFGRVGPEAEQVFKSSDLGSLVGYFFVNAVMP